MKKLVWFAVLGLCVITAVFAKVVVFEDGKATSYDQGSSVSVSGKTDTRVLYDGILVDVPEVQKVEISKAKDGNVLVSGENIEGVEINGEKISSEGQAVFSVSPDDHKIYQTEAALKAEQEQALRQQQEALLKKQEELAKKQEALRQQKKLAKQKAEQEKIARQQEELAKQQEALRQQEELARQKAEAAKQQAEAAKQKAQKDTKAAFNKAESSQSETTFADFPDTTIYVSEVVMQQAVMDVVSPYTPR